MAIPHRGRTGKGTYFISADCWMKKRLLQSDRSAALFIELMLEYRDAGNFELHEFVPMPHHFHLILTPSSVTLERSLQLIKGRFSREARNRSNILGEIWQPSFHDRRIRDGAEYAAYRDYIHMNPVKAGLCSKPEDFPYSSASGKYRLDPVPPWLKPLSAHA